MVINQKKEIYLLFAIFFIIISLILFFIIIPAIKGIKNLNEGIQAQRLEIEKRYIQTHSSRRITNLSKIKTDLETLSSVFIKEDLELEFITALEKIALQNNLEQSIQLQPTNQKMAGQINVIQTQISLKGNFIDFLKYLQKLETLGYYININSINLNTQSLKKETISPAQGGAGQISAVISGETYWE
jgi:Tfp pilus assembly protein PilO